MNFSYTRNATTLTTRLWAAVGMVKRISWLPHRAAQKVMFIANGALNLGLYGCEVAEVNEQALVRSRLPSPWRLALIPIGLAITSPLAS